MSGPPTLATRAAGLLLHPTSLPGPLGSGDLGPEAHDFAGFLAAHGLRWWQMLPINPTGMGESPYQALSSFAGNPLLVSPEALADDGLLRLRDLDAARVEAGDRADFAHAANVRELLLRQAWGTFQARGSEELREELAAFKTANALWLPDYALYRAIKAASGERGWLDWKRSLRQGEPQALAAARGELAGDLAYHEFVQYLFDRQWRALRARCGQLGVGLIGDIPIFVAHDSADVWTHPDLFRLDAEGRPEVVAGVPPDYFSTTGQLWGNPLYRWEALRERGYGWWVERLRASFARFDAVRLDHFIGFHNYWEIPGGDPTAEQGRWVPGPGPDFFARVQEALGDIQLIAEDLGVVTPEVTALRERFGFPGMRVLQMAFGDDPTAADHLPHNHTRSSVVYTGTHDNDTTVGWFTDEGSEASTRTPEAIAREQALALRYLDSDGREIHWDMIRMAMLSVAGTAIVPVQDALGLGTAARMNRPGTMGGNWAWRLREGQLQAGTGERLAELAATFGRAGEESR